MRGHDTLIMRRLRPVIVILTAVSTLVVFALVSSPLLAARAEDRETVWVSTNTEKSDVSAEQPVDEVLAILEPPDASSGAPEIERAAQATGGAAPTWTSVVALYLHAADLKGTTTLGRIEVPVDVGFSTLIDKLQTAFTAHAETQRGPVGAATRGHEGILRQGRGGDRRGCGRPLRPGGTAHQHTAGPSDGRRHSAARAAKSKIGAGQGHAKAGPAAFPSRAPGLFSV